MKLMTTDGMRFAVEAQQLENFNIFVHLTIKLCEDGDVRREVTTRTDKTSAAFNGRIFFNITGITRKTKLQLSNALVMAWLLYSCEPWKRSV